MEEKKKAPSIDYSLTRNEIKFSDRVRLQTNKNGFLLTFGQIHPDKEEVLCVSEVHLSPEVGGSLASMFLAHIVRYEKKYNIKITPPGMQIEPVEETKDKEETEH